MQNQNSAFSSRKPATLSPQDYSWWDSPEFAERYLTGEGKWLRLYLDGVHCAACLWLVESLPTWLPGVVSARLDLGRGIADIQLRDGFRVSQLGEELSNVGYRPTPVAGDHEAHALARKTNRKELIRIAIAGACAGNLMLFFIPMYAGASSEDSSLFRWLSGFLFLPVLFYCLNPFLSGARASLRKRSASIDLPISAAVIFASIASYRNLFLGLDALYFDSLGALVFLLLASRHFMRQAQWNAMRGESLGTLFGCRRARRISGEEIPAESLATGDEVEVLTDTAFPADGILLSPSAEVDLSLLTGEAVPKTTLAGETVYAGTHNRGPAVTARVTALGHASRLGQILQLAQQEIGNKAPVAMLSDRIAKFFVFGVLGVAVMIFALKLGGSYEAAFQRALALLVVSCPCAFALSVPICLSLALRLAARRGILIKDGTTLEKLAKIKNVFFDKTGTLTYGRLEVFEARGLEGSAKAVLLALETPSRHPIARSLVNALRTPGPIEILSVENYIETSGRGVAGTVEGEHYEVRACDADENSPDLGITTRIGLYQNGYNIAEVALKDCVREDSVAAIRDLETQGLRPWLISGDGPGPVREAATQVGIPLERAFSRCTPEQKNDLIKAHQNTLFVGDGANDAIALSSADVGIAVHGCVETSLRVSGVYLSDPGVSSTADLIRLARVTLRVIYRNLFISVLYNAVGVTAAVIGVISPLTAAILMPVSSVTVLLLSCFGIREKNISALPPERGPGK